MENEKRRRTRRIAKGTVMTVETRRKPRVVWEALEPEEILAGIPKVNQ